MIAAAAPLFMICGFVQLGDAAGVLLSAALTALGDTRTPFLLTTGWYWLLGAPLSWWLTFHTALSVKGLWIGRAVAALTTTAATAVAWHMRLRKLEGSRSSPASLSLLSTLTGESVAGT